MKKLFIIVPAYNEAEIFEYTVQKLDNILSSLIDQKKVSEKSQIVFVNDGSKDTTWLSICKTAFANDHISGINLSRNYGHQNAIMAGLTETMKHGGELFITIDADLQDDETKIIDMVNKANQGYDIVYGARRSRETDTAFKRNTASMFYKLMHLLHVEMVPNSADYRLMSKRAVEELLQFKESNLFLRGIVPQIGFPSDVVYYDRNPRKKGVSKYPLKKMLLFAWSGITSFTIAPIRIVLGLGVMTILMAIGMMVYTVFGHFFGQTTSGWSSLMISIWFLGGVQLLSVAILGEYIGKIFQEVKKRPRFVIQDDLL